MNIPESKLRSILTAAGIPAISWNLFDTSFETVSREWVLDNWKEWLNSRSSELVEWNGGAIGIGGRVRPLWIDGARDCENLALGTMAHGAEGNALAAMRRKTKRGGLAYGLVCYVAGPARPENFNIEGRHAINWFIDHYEQVGFFEPGMGQFVDLNISERATSWPGLAA